MDLDLSLSQTNDNFCCLHNPQMHTVFTKPDTKHKTRSYSTQIKINSSFKSQKRLTLIQPSIFHGEKNEKQDGRNMNKGKRVKMS